MKKIILSAILAFTVSAFSIAQELEDIVNEISTEIDLDDTQKAALANQMGKYTTSLQLIFDKYEEAEPDPQAMLVDIKNAREEYEAALKKDIGKEKFNAYLAFVEKVKLEVLGEAAYLRLLDLQDPLKMSDDQVMAMKPVMAKAMLGMLNTLMKYVDKLPLNVRNKLGAAGALKGIKKTFDRETAEILTGEQIKKWEEMKEAGES